MIIAVLVLLANTTSLFADPLSQVEVGLVAPGKQHLMGTDRLGRDVLSRVVYGAESSLTVASLAMVTALPVGTGLGLLSGYISGKFDLFARVPMDALNGFPAFLLALCLAFALGPGLVNTAVALAIAWIPLFYRLSRSLALSIRESTFIEAARVTGANKAYIVFKHVLPNSASSLLVFSTVAFARVLVTGSSLSFMGAGIPPPTPEWGADLRLGLLAVGSGAWWPVLFPGLMLFLSALAFNLIGEALTVVLNPRYAKT